VRFTIERIRTLVVVAAVLLLAALGAFLVRAKWKNLLSGRDLPARLAKGITEESNGYSYSHNLGAHSKFKIHASKAVQLKNDHIELHDVQIEIYGEDGTQTDKITGDEFEYNQKTGIASAQGPVEMILTRPPAPAGTGKKIDGSHTAAAVGDSGQVHVKTSGVTFDRNTGVVTTDQRVDFSMTKGFGSAVGASYDSQRGYLTLVQAVDLTTYRGTDEVQIHAQHGEFDRAAQLCLLRAATLEYRDGQAEAAQAKVLFRDDGSVVHLDATGGFALTTATGGRLASPTAAMDFDEHNQPRHGHLEGGVILASKQQGDSAQESHTVHGTSPTAELDFTAQGQLHHAHLERGVIMQSEASSLPSPGQTLHVSRTWRSPVADVEFRTIKGGGESAGKTQLEPEMIHGTGGVVITSESRLGNAAPVPAKMTADEVTGTFGEGSSLRTLVGTGHAEMEQTTATGAQQTASGDRLEASFAPPATSQNREQRSATPAGNREQKTSEQGNRGGAQATGAPDVQTAELDGHVVLFQQPAAKPGAQPRPPLRAIAGKAVYESAGEWLHLTGSSRTGNEPRVVNGGLELTADKVDVSRESDVAFAHGNVKATWTGENSTGENSTGGANPGGTGQTGTRQGGTGQGSVALGGNGPAHVIAAEAQMNQSTGEATFRGHARLWQQANSVAAPEIVLNQQLQTLTARTADAADPVRAVLLSAGAPGMGVGTGNGAGTAHSQGLAGGSAAKPATPSVIRVRGGDLKYSGAEHRAVMHGGVAGAVVAETGTATSTSDTVDLLLIPAGNRDSGVGPAQGGQKQSAGSQAQVDRMTATGHVVLTSEGRRGTGEQLVYSGVTGDYVLTGTAAAPPRMTDPAQGNVTGEALIFHSRDDSVSIEGGGHRTRTETTAPQAHDR
jgi:lipopolysaccharide export system protein LptA